jgi:hypothetical protein
MYPVVNFPVIRQPQIVELFRGTKSGILCAEVGSANVNGINIIHQLLSQTAEIFKCNFGLAFKNCLYIIRPHQNTHVPFCNIANTFRIFSLMPGICAISPSAVPPSPQPRLFRLPVLFVWFFPVFQIAFRNQTIFFQIIIWIKIFFINGLLADYGIKK